MNPIIVKRLVGVNAISMSSGRKLREEILNEWSKSEKIVIDFEGVEVFASPFFNSGVGFLLKDNDIAQLQGKLVFEGISDHGRRLLNLVIDNAIRFYADSESKTTAGLDEIKRDV